MECPSCYSVISVPGRKSLTWPNSHSHSHFCSTYPHFVFPKVHLVPYLTSALLPTQISSLIPLTTLSILTAGFRCFSCYKELWTWYSLFQVHRIEIKRKAQHCRWVSFKIERLFSREEHHCSSRKPSFSSQNFCSG